MTILGLHDVLYPRAARRNDDCAQPGAGTGTGGILAPTTPDQRHETAGRLMWPVPRVRKAPSVAFADDERQPRPVVGCGVAEQEYPSFPFWPKRGGDEPVSTLKKIQASHGPVN